MRRKQNGYSDVRMYVAAPDRKTCFNSLSIGNPAGAISHEEEEEVIWADIVAVGKDRQTKDQPTGQSRCSRSSGD